MPRPTPPRHQRSDSDRTRRLDELLRIARQLDLDATIAAIAADEAGWMARVTAEVEDRQHKAAKAAAWAAAIADRQAAALAAVGGWDGFARKVVSLGLLDEDGVGTEDAADAARLWAEMDATRRTTGMTGPELVLAAAETPEENGLDPWEDPWTLLRDDARRALDLLFLDKVSRLGDQLARLAPPIDPTQVAGLPPAYDRVPEVRWHLDDEDASGEVEASWAGITGRYHRTVVWGWDAVGDDDARRRPNGRREVSARRRRVHVRHLDGGDPVGDRERVVLATAALRDETVRGNRAGVDGVAARWVEDLAATGRLDVGTFRRDELISRLFGIALEVVRLAVDAVSLTARGPSLGEVASRALGRDMSSLDG